MATPTQPPGQDGADPSMEDILASIRRILNEDEAAPAQGALAEHDRPEHVAREPVVRPTEPHVEGGGGGDVLMLDVSMMVPEPPARPAAAAPPALPPQPAPLPAPAGLIAAATETAAVNSVNSMLRTLTSERATQVYRGGPTLEDLARDEMRPLLAAWLDQHLPPMVERLVRVEIERVLGRVLP